MSTPHCSVEEIHFLLDRALTPVAAAAAEAHIAACPRCAARFQALRSFDGAVRSLPLTPTSPGFSARVMSAIDPLVLAPGTFRVFTWISIQAGFLFVLLLTLGVCAAAGFITPADASGGTFGGAVFAFLESALAECGAVVTSWLGEPARTGLLLITFSATLVLLMLGLIDRNFSRKLTHR